jgi:hypothetical protein
MTSSRRYANGPDQGWRRGTVRDASTTPGESRTGPGDSLSRSRHVTSRKQARGQLQGCGPSSDGSGTDGGGSRTRRLCNRNPTFQGSPEKASGSKTDETDEPPFRAKPTILPETPTSDIGHHVNGTTPEYSANPTFARAPSPEAGSSRAPGYTPGPIPGGEIPFPWFCVATYDRCAGSVSSNSGETSRSGSGHAGLSGRGAGGQGQAVENRLRRVGRVDGGQDAHRRPAVGDGGKFPFSRRGFASASQNSPLAIKIRWTTVCRPMRRPR